MAEVGTALNGVAGLAGFVPGIGTAIAGIAGLAAGFFPGDPSALNPFYGDGRYAGGMYDPPKAWRPNASTAGASLFQGALWGVPVHPDDLNRER